MLVTIGILFVVIVRVFADANNTTNSYQHYNRTSKNNQTNMVSDLWLFPLSIKCLHYFLNTTVFITGCVGNTIVIYVLGVRKLKVSIFLLKHDFCIF